MPSFEILLVHKTGAEKHNFAIYQVKLGVLVNASASKPVLPIAASKLDALAFYHVKVNLEDIL